MLPNVHTQFGYHDGVSTPLIEGNDAPGLPGQGPAIKAGEFIFGYHDEMGTSLRYLSLRYWAVTAPIWPSVSCTPCGGVPQFPATTPRALKKAVAGRFLGRWPSGAPLVLAPERDDPELGADPQRNNDFRYYEEDPKGLKCPAGAHIRRTNPRDALKDTPNVNIHRIVRRGFIYGPMLPEGVMEDDGVDRGIVFQWMGAYLDRQFEFVKSQWHNDGNFAGLADEKDLIAGANDGSGTFTIPSALTQALAGRTPVCDHEGVSTASPSIRALHWLAELDT